MKNNIFEKNLLKSKNAIRERLNDKSNNKYIYADKNRTILFGTGHELLTLLTIIVDKLKETSVPEEMIKKAFDLGISKDKEAYIVENLLKTVFENVLKDNKEDK
jgi:hypothetical protein